jgi:glycosyltransferase involved in cell wall biosynthesis
MELTILMPCLNEAETLPVCIEKASRFMHRQGIDGEVLIADNGSTDGSPQIAGENGARVIHVEQPGYGAALRGGIEAANGRFVIMGDADDSYDFSRLEAFVERLRAGYQLVMGNRFQGGIAPGAMPPLHRYLGNPVLSFVGRLFFNSPARDFHCGLRGFDREAILALDLVTPGMEFASEMVVKASLLGMQVCEVPTTLSPDGRSGAPHLRSFRDGWRHLRFLLLFSPRWLFLYPGLVLMLVGIGLGAWLLPGPRAFFGVVLDVHTLLYAAIAILIGFQLVAFGLFSKFFAVSHGLHPRGQALQRFLGVVTLEVGLLVGLALVLLGLGIGLYAVWLWDQRSFGVLDPQRTLRWVIPSAVCLALGVQIMFSSFFLSVLGLRRR